LILLSQVSHKPELKAEGESLCTIPSYAGALRLKVYALSLILVAPFIIADRTPGKVGLIATTGCCSKDGPVISQ
jgi:hypothetical protein